MLIIGPVLMPYLRWKGLSYTEIMWLQSISAFSVVLFEVPTGAIADKISRILWTVCLACLMGFAARVGFWLYEPYFTHVHTQGLLHSHSFAMFNVKRNKYNPYRHERCRFISWQ